MAPGSPHATVLPPPRVEDAPYRIALVCLGNICRSPMAEVVLSDRIAAAGLDRSVRLDSAGTGDWHVGNPMDRRAATALTARGYDASAHRASHFDASWYDDVDLVLVMDDANHATVSALAPTRADADRVMFFREFDPEATPTDREVPDPYFGGDDGFDEVLRTVERTADAIVSALHERVAG